MNKQIEEALKMAIEAIEYQESLDPFESSTTEWNHSWKELHKALIICKEALAETEKQEPVAERFLMKDNGKSYWVYDDYQNSKGWQALYTKEQI